MGICCDRQVDQRRNKHSQISKIYNADNEESLSITQQIEDAQQRQNLIDDSDILRITSDPRFRMSEEETTEVLSNAKFISSQSFEISPIKRVKSILDRKEGTLDQQANYFGWYKNREASVDDCVFRVFEGEKLKLCLNFRLYKCVCEKNPDKGLQFKIYFRDANYHKPFEFQA